MKIGIIDSSPVFALGLERLVTEAGYEVVANVGTFDRHALWRADIILVEEHLLDPDRFMELVRLVPWLTVIITCASRTPRRHLGGEVVTLYRSTSREGLIDTIRNASAKGGEQCEDQAVDVVSQHTDQTGLELSPREKEVLFGIAQGLTHRQVARQISISQHTVDTYVKRIRSKLGVGNKAELTRIAVSMQISGSYRDSRVERGSEALWSGGMTPNPHFQ